MIAVGAVPAESQTALIGRDRELRQIADLVDGTPQRGSALVIAGPAGIGKSALLHAAVHRAREAGFAVLDASGAESESRPPLATLNRLIQPLSHLVESRPLPQRRALLSVLGGADEPAPEPFLTALAGFNLLVEAAAGRPILVAVDDVQWCDEASQQAMSFIARRLGHDPIGLIAARREGLAGRFAELGVPELRPSALDGAAARELLARSAAGLDLADREHVLREAAGNPLALVELPAAWRKVREAGNRDGRAVPPAQPLTPRLESAFAAHLSDLPPLTRDTLLVAAIDDQGGLPEILKAACVLVGRPVPVNVLEAAVAARFVVFDGLRLRFRHPLIRSAVIGAESAARVLAANSALADVLGEEPHRRLWHRAQAVVGVDDALADELAAAHTESLRRGLVLAAVKALERSAELATDPAFRARRLLLAAEHAFGLGRAGLVDRLLRSAARVELSDLDRARKEWLREIFHDGRPGEADRVFELCATAERSHLAGDTDLAWHLLIGAAQRCWWAEPGAEARTRVVRVADALSAPDHKSPHDDPRRIAAVAIAEPVRQYRTASEGLARVRFTHDARPDTLRLLGHAAHAIGDLPVAADLLGRAAPLLREEGRFGLLSHVLTMLAIDQLLLGDWESGRKTIEEGRQVAEATEQPVWHAASTGVSAIAKALSGTTEQAWTLVTSAEDAANRLGLGNLLARVQLARGLAELTADRPEQAYRELRRMFDAEDPSHHQRESFSAVMFFAEAATRIGRCDEARQTIAELEVEVAVSGSPLLRTQLLYAHAVLADDHDAEVTFLSALGRDLTRWPFVRAKLELAYGMWLRATSRLAEARGRLHSAQATLEHLGAKTWAEQARAELQAAGEHGDEPAAVRWDALSSQEREIAKLAAKGLSNREIGEHLCLSPRTIGSHLYRIFPKLGVTARGQLAARLGA